MRSWRRWLAEGSVLLLCLSGCSRPRPPANLVLVTTDTTRADHLGCYGYEAATSPHIDELAAEGVRFERARAHVPITLPSHTTLFTGLLPPYHGVRDNGRFVVADELTTLAEMLARSGYSTAAFVSAFVLDSRFGLDQGFEVYDDDYSREWSEQDLRDAMAHPQMVVERDAEQTTQRALEWLAGARQPFFLWVHYYDPHQSYRPPPAFAHRFPRSAYDGEIAYMDSQIGRLWEALRQGGLWNPSLVALTADHGEGLGEHGEPTHATLVYESTLRVPLILKPPGGRADFETVVQQAVSQVDILPTLLELLGVEPPAGPRHGRSLVAQMRGARGVERPSYFECLAPRLAFGWAPVFGLRSGGWKYIHAEPPELYRLDDDPHERVDLAASEPQRAAAIGEALFDLLAAVGRSAPGTDRTQLSAEARRKLAALGYLSSASRAFEPLAMTPRRLDGRRNPMQQVVLLGDYYVAIELAAQGRTAEAAAILERVLVPEDPTNPAFLGQLAAYQRLLGRRERAYQLMRRSVELDPSNPEAVTELALLEADRSHLDQAEVLLETAIELEPDNVRPRFLAGAVAALRGEPELAIARYRAATSRDASHRQSWVELGVELAKLGRYGEARQALETALGIAPLDRAALHNLGLVELAAGRPRRAMELFQRVLRFHPDDPEERLALASAELVVDRKSARRRLQELIDEAPDSPTAARARELLAD